MAFPYGALWPSTSNRVCCQFFVALIVCQTATAQLSPGTVELDLVFPRAGGKYAETSDGLPVVLSLQNPDVAYHYGWVFSWDVYKKPHPRVDRLPFNTIGSTLKNDTVYPDNPRLEVAYTGHLDAGEYTFSWTVHTGPWCELVPGSSEYRANAKVANGTFEFTVESGAPTPTFTSTCATALGMISYASLTTYHGVYEETNDHLDNPSSTILSCAVTANVTASPEPCRATVNEAQETSMSSRLHWGTYATASPSASGVTSAGSSMQALRMFSFLATIKAHLMF
ncbi:hypothetical protein LY78DRAFT_657318 [Colletotrichum sublineola]|uniref:DUF7136 domain-containing protein n=1 Tax=Colletotrichum sublineola TaxID=1173701 RepID=A0A066XTI7_COLSU|nr:hypothetical protein LY78DRAFT_657318 [Colletotrichum sublineola]KDN69066.1 hypothetical protein CSUB01_10060 [Colletotrichum sublineola]